MQERAGRSFCGEYCRTAQIKTAAAVQAIIRKQAQNLMSRLSDETEVQVKMV